MSSLPTETATVVLDVSDLPSDLAFEQIQAAGEFGTAIPSSIIDLRLSGEQLAVLLDTVTLSETPSGRTPAEKPAASNAPKTEKAPEADNDNEEEAEELPVVKRRSKDEIAAGLSTLQAAKFRASGLETPEAWLEAAGEAPDESVEDEAEESPEQEETDTEEDDEPENTPSGKDDEPDTEADIEIPEIEYDELKAQVLDNVKNGLKAPTLKVAKDVFDVANFTHIEDAKDWGRALVILQKVAELEKFPPKSFIEEVLAA